MAVPHTSEPEPSARVAGQSAGPLGAPGIDAATPVDPPGPAGDLGAEIASFTTLDDCVRARAKLDPLVSDTIDALGYDTLLGDACRILAAAKAAQPRACDAIAASPVRERCIATVAEVIGDPDTCPWVDPERPQIGRDPACVALASRDVRLCAGVGDRAKRVTCEAIATHEPSRCNALTGPLAAADRSVCARGVDRMRSVVPTSTSAERGPGLRSGTHGRELRVTGTLRIEDTREPRPSPIDVDWGRDPEIARGVVVAHDPSGARFSVGSFSPPGSDFIAASPHVRPRLALAVLVPANPSHRAALPAAPSIVAAELVVPGRTPVATPLATSKLTVNVSSFAADRGAPLAFTVDGTLSNGAGSYRVHGEVTTFVRDVVEAALDVDARNP